MGDNGMCTLCAPTVLPLCFCPSGFYCNSNSAEFPGCERCPAGFYCPIPGDRVPPLPCPSGFFCPESTFLPVKCQAGAICGSSRQFFLLGPFFCLLVLCLLWVPNLLRRHHLFATFSFSALVKKLRHRRNSSIDYGVSSSVSSSNLTEKLQQPNERERRSSLAQVSESVTIELKNVKVKIGGCCKSSKTILDITGYFTPGTLTAVMGPSGAGKTTLLTILKGGIQPSSGEVFVNGKKTNLASFRQSTGYAPQDDDTVDPDLTVREALMLSAQLRLPRHITYQGCCDAVEAVLEVLGLTSIADSVIGTGGVHEAGARGISGGERKRVNIGIELIMSPSCLLVDEPTTGLDSVNAAKVIDYLQRIASLTKVTVVTTIHQPNQRIFSMFDSLLLLVDGQVAFWGPSTEAGAYFHGIGAPVLVHTAVPDMMMDFVSENKHLVIEKYAQLQLKRSLPSASIHPVGRAVKRTTSFFPFQLVLQLRRIATRGLRQARAFTLSLAVFGFSGIYLGVSFVAPKFVLPVPSSVSEQCPRAVQDMTNGERWNQPCATDWPNSEVQGLAAMFFCMGVGTVAAAYSVKTLGQDKGLYWRETASGINPFALIIAKFVVDLIYIALFALFFISGYFFVASPFGAFSEYFILTCAEIWVCFGLGYFMSSLFDSQNASIIAMTLSLVAGVFSGFVFQPSSPMWTFFYSEGLFRSEIQFVLDHAESEDQPYIATYANQVYDYGVGNDVISHDVWMLFLWGLGFRLLAAVIMRLNHWSKQR